MTFTAFPVLASILSATGLMHAPIGVVVSGHCCCTTCRPSRRHALSALPVHLFTGR
jgi:hypothetical protein